MGKFEDLSSLLEGFVENGLPGCACAVAKNGKTLYEGYYGYADIEEKKLITPDTVYRLFSMTKVIICAAALILFERGKYLLSEPLYEYFPEYKNPQMFKKDPNGNLNIVPAKNPMLIKHAFSHAVGLPYPAGNSGTRREMVRVRDELKQKKGKFNLQTEIKAISQVPIAFEPGTQWLYDYGHTLVAGLIEVVSGKTVGQFLKDEIFDPLGMESTGYRFHDDIEERMAVMYERTEDGKLVKIEHSLDEFHKPDAIYESGGTGLYSTVGDYLRFTQMMANGGEIDGVKIIGRKTIDLMRRNHLNEAQLADFTNFHHPSIGTAGYGYGLGVRTMMDPAAGHSNSSVGEFGWAGFAGTWTSIDPSEGFSAVYMQQMPPLWGGLTRIAISESAPRLTDACDITEILCRV